MMTNNYCWRVLLAKMAAAATAWEELTEKLTSTSKEVKGNLVSLLNEWREFQREVRLTAAEPGSPPVSAPQHMETSKEYVMVRRCDLERLATETMQLKEFLPKVLNTEYLSALPKLTQLEQEMSATHVLRDAQDTEHQTMKTRMEAALSECEQTREEKFRLQMEVSELTSQLTQETEYCSSMGSACCTLLWRVSQQEEVVPAILGGSRIGEFLELVGSTLDSYVQTYKEQDLGPSFEGRKEAQFVLAICGTITNIAASAYGRDFLTSRQDGLQLVDVFCTSLSEIPEKHSGFHKLKSLILMSLYNISINHKGVRHLNSRKDVLPTIGWLIQVDMDSKVKLYALRLLQSLILEPENPSVAHRALEVVPFHIYTKLAQDKNPEIRQVAVEVMSDLNATRN